MSKEAARIAVLLQHNHVCMCDFDTLQGQEHHETEMRKLAALLKAAEDAVDESVPESINKPRKPRRTKDSNERITSSDDSAVV